MSAKKATLPPFRFLPEHVERFKGFYPQARGGVYHIKWRDPLVRTKWHSARGGTTYTEVVTTLEQLSARVHSKRPIVTTVTKTWQVIEDWFEQEVIPKKAPSTTKNYAYLVERFILPNLGEIRFSELSESVIDEFLERIDEFDTADPLLKRHDGVSVEQVNSLKKTVKSLCRWASAQGYTLGNPAANIRFETAEHSEQPIYTPEQFEFVLEFVNDYYMVHLMTLYWSSLRPGELAALSWRNVVFREDGRVDINVSRGLSLKTIGKTKTPKSRRTVTLPVSIATALKEHREVQRSTQLAHPDDLVFTTSTGKTLDIARLRERHFYKAQERANKFRAMHELEPLPRVSLKGLRHSSITVLSDGRLSDKAVQRHAGHTNQRTTDGYTHRDAERRHAVADRLEEARDAALEALEATKETEHTA